MKQAMRKVLLTSAVLILAGAGTNAWAQYSPPPGPPQPRDEGRTDYSLVPVSECAVRMGGTIQLGATTVGGGTVTFQNTGNRLIAAIRMSLEYRTASGDVISKPANLRNITFSKPPGKAWVYPGVTRPAFLFPTNVAKRGDSIVSVTPRVLGVVYGDGNTCGPEGEATLRRYQYHLQGIVEDLRIALDLCNKLDYASLQRFIAEEKITRMRNGGGQMVARQLKKLLDADGNLLPDPAGRIQEWLNNVEQPFSKGAS